MLVAMAARAKTNQDVDPVETREWIESLKEVVETAGHERARYLLGWLVDWGKRHEVVAPFAATTPYTVKRSDLVGQTRFEMP